MVQRKLTREEILDYEVKASWWAARVNNRYLQELAGSYFAWKINRKYNHYLIAFDAQEWLAKSEY